MVVTNKGKYENRDTGDTSGIEYVCCPRGLHNPNSNNFKPLVNNNHVLGTIACKALLRLHRSLRADTYSEQAHFTAEKRMPRVRQMDKESTAKGRVGT